MSVADLAFEHTLDAKAKPFNYRPRGDLLLQQLDDHLADC